MTEAVRTACDAITMFIERYLQLMPETQQMLSKRCDVMDDGLRHQRNAQFHFESLAFQTSLDRLKEEARARLSRLSEPKRVPRIDVGLLFATLDDPRLEGFREAVGDTIGELEELRILSIKCENEAEERLYGA